MKRRTIIPNVLIFSILLTIFGFTYFSTKTTFASLQEYQHQKLWWSSCSKGVECATLKVPYNYANIVPDQSFSLFVLRHLATDTKHRLGTLIVNPGGPGGSGVDYAYNWETIVSKQISDRYDIIGFDQRGVNHSQPIRCLTDKQADKYLSTDGKVVDQNSLDAAIASAKDFADKCASAAGEKLGRYGTLNAARDMDLLRQVLGAPTLNFIGKSYGTYLGALYADLYPDDVGRMVLDGAIDPQESVFHQNLYQAKGFDLALKSYLAANPIFTANQITTFLDGLQGKPIMIGKREFTQSLAITAIASGLYDNQTGWPQLTAALGEVAANKPPLKLLAMADSYNYRDSNGHFMSNQTDLQQIISCLDFADPRSIDQMTADQKEFAKVAPVFGPYLGYAGLTCKYWHAPPVVTSDFTPLKKVPPVIVIGVTRDPATPYQWAVSLHQDFAQSVLLTYDGDGHTGHNRGSVCIDSKVDAYLLTGAIPPASVTCKAPGA